MRIRPLRPEDAERCDAIVAELPQWFGNEQGRADCREAVRTQEGLVAEGEDGVIGFLTLKRRFEETQEISWMAVSPEQRRRGVGRLLIREAVAVARGQGVKLLVVHTLSEAEDYPPYAETRAFYRGVGFLRAAERPDLWGPEDPALMLVLAL